MKKARVRDEFLREIRKTPIIQVACDKVGISRQTYYRWREQDFDFKVRADKALDEGEELVNDVAESTVLRGIQNQDKYWTTFWLDRRHPKFRKSLERKPKVPVVFDSEKAKEMMKRWFVKAPESKTKSSQNQHQT